MKDILFSSFKKLKTFYEMKCIYQNHFWVGQISVAPLNGSLKDKSLQTIACNIHRSLYKRYAISIDLIFKSYFIKILLAKQITVQKPCQKDKAESLVN